MIVPYFNMSARVEIGKVTFQNVTSLRIIESIIELGDTAEIIVPRNYKNLKAQKLTDYIKAGDTVKIYFGYDEKLELEFEGYLKPFTTETPLILACDQMWPLKQNDLVKTYQSTTLKKLLQDIAPGFQIECPELELRKYQIPHKSTYGVLQDIQNDFGLYSRLVGNRLELGFSYQWDVSKTKRWKYHRQKNVKASNLDWKFESDFNVLVQVNFDIATGKKKKATFGSSLEKTRVLKRDFHYLSKSSAEQVAQALYRKAVYNGFTGTITGFCLPRTAAGDSLELIDEREPGRDGVYLIERVIKTYNENTGISRENTLGYKIS